MIGYVTLGTNDMARTGEFYDALLGEIGATRQIELERFIAWSVGPGTPMLWVIKPFDDAPATVGNGVMVALAVDSRDHVDRLHAKALSLGADDEGAPGLRGDTFYGAYFRDPDGNKLAVFDKAFLG